MNDNIFKTIQDGSNFIFEAGPGSGKTTTLIRTLHQILMAPDGIIDPTSQKIACITFTNVAANEIRERLGANFNAVHVSTIHSFLWQVIRSFQNELRRALCIFNDRLGPSNKRYIPNLNLDSINIEYVDHYADLSKGEISHDDVLELAFHMIEEYSTLRHLIKCQYPVLLLDEYQDTQDIVIETLSLLIEADSQTAFGKIDFRVGLFGDSMQSIYDSGAGYVDPQRLDAITITKEDNYRSTPNIVRLINKVRAKSNLATRVEQQVQRTDLPQRSICSLFYTTNDITLSLRSLDAIASHFDWSLGEDTKVLELTHSAISKTANWNNLQKAYTYRGRDGFDRLRVGDDTYSSTFSFISRLYKAWASHNGYSTLQLLRSESPGYIRDRNVVTSTQDMIHWTSILNEFVRRCNSDNVEESSISAILRFVFDEDVQLCRRIDRVARFESYYDLDDSKLIENRQKFLAALTETHFSELLHFYDYLDQATPFSTQHGTKGTEYDNVILLIDDSTWKNKYSFSTVFGASDRIADRVQRTLNLFYVSISRARNNLIVVYKNPKPDRIAGAKELFGEDNVQPLEEALPDIAIY